MANEKTWMSMTAGILDIICGCWALLIAFILVFLGSIFKLAATAQIPPFLAPIIAALGIPFAIIGILASWRSIRITPESVGLSAGWLYRFPIFPPPLLFGHSSHRFYGAIQERVRIVARLWPTAQVI